MCVNLVSLLSVISVFARRNRQSDFSLSILNLSLSPLVLNAPAFVYNHPQHSLISPLSRHTQPSASRVFHSFLLFRFPPSRIERLADTVCKLLCLLAGLVLPSSLSLANNNTVSAIFLFCDLFPSLSLSLSLHRSSCTSRTERVSTGGPMASFSTRCWSASRRSTARMKRNSLPPSRIRMFPTRKPCPRRPRKSAKESVHFFI